MKKLILKAQKYKKPEFLVSIIGLTMLTLIFIIWVSKRELSFPEFFSALTSVVLFAVLCLKFVPIWMNFWRNKPKKQRKYKAINRFDRHTEIVIFISLILVNVLVVVAAFLLRKLTGYEGSFIDNLEFWTFTDARHYLDIARDWYLSEGTMDRLVQLVFLPGFPIAIKLVNIIVNNYLYSSMIVSVVSFAGAGCVIYRLILLDYSREDALRMLWFLCLLPGAFFFVAPLSESLFLLLSACCIYFARKNKWLLGCIFGALASFTRSLGLILFVPLLFEIISKVVRDKDRSKKQVMLKRYLPCFMELFLVFLGFAIYCYINYQVAGNPFKFMEYQHKHWSQSLGLFFNTAAYQIKYAIEYSKTNIHGLLGLWLPNIISCFSSLVIMIFAVKKLRPSYTAWYIAYYVVAIGSTWLLSAPRYLISLIPLSLALSLITRKRKVDVILTALSVMLNLCYFYAFVMNWLVY